MKQRNPINVFSTVMSTADNRTTFLNCICFLAAYSAFIGLAIAVLTVFAYLLGIAIR